MKPAEAIQRIEDLDKFGINLGLERIAACLEALGHPQRLVPCVHVGGTNGKGSTAALIASVLASAGYRTGLYTSPPLETFGERIRVDGAPLPPEQVPDLLQAVSGAADSTPAAAGMTQFEVITAMAFLHFRRVAAQVAVYEVGLGGRLDSTNVVSPEVAVITNVGLEHVEHLGPTVAAIAREKGGIVKPGAALVTAAEGEALGVLEGIARGVGSPVLAWERDFWVAAEGDGTLRYRGPTWELTGLHLPLLGAFQQANLGVALAAIEALRQRGWKIDERHASDGIARTRWDGRMECLGTGPRVLLDGAHNPSAAAALRGALEAGFPRATLWLVLGILADKDARSVIAALAPLADRILVTRSGSRRARDTAEVEDLVRAQTRAEVASAATVAEALDRTLAQAGPEDLICVTGSLTVIGEARTHLRALGWIL